MKRAPRRRQPTGRVRPRRPSRRGARARPRRPASGAIQIRRIDSLRAELKRVTRVTPPRWNADPDDVQRSVAKLVLTLVELVRKLLERQAVRRMQARTLTPKEIEAVGLALMRLEKTLRALARRFGIPPEDLNLDLGPLGRLM